MTDPEHHEAVGHYFNMSVEEFEAGFLQDAEPENQVALWSGVTAAWIAYRTPIFVGWSEVQEMPISSAGGRNTFD